MQVRKCSVQHGVMRFLMQLLPGARSFITRPAGRAEKGGGRLGAQSRVHRFECLASKFEKVPI
jgi:hypothetical protein